MKPQLPGDTRRKSKLICLESFLTNRPHYIQIIQDHVADFDATLMRKVKDYNLFCQARDLVDQLKPVVLVVVIDKAQNDTTGLADVCKMIHFSSLTKIEFSIFCKVHQTMPYGCIQVASWIQKMWTNNTTRRVSCRVANTISNREGPMIC